MDFTKLLFRASGNGDIMTPGSGEITEIQLGTLKELEDKKNAPGKGPGLYNLTDKQEEELKRLKDKRDNPTLSQTCIKRCLITYAQATGREEEIKSRYLTKGTIAEEDSITLYSRIKKKNFIKNELHLTGEYTEGTPDMGSAKRIQDAAEIIDIKTAWSLITFLQTQFKAEASHDNEWQGHTYMGLLKKAKRFRLVHCLVNSPPEVIQGEKRSLKFSMPDVIDEDASPEYIEGCRRIERNHIFDLALFRQHHPWFEFHTDLSTWAYDIPAEKRVFERVIERDEDKIRKLYSKITRCRTWMSENL